MSARRVSRAVALAFAVGLVSAGPAAAHRLKLFVTVEGSTVAGRAFFVGGGRPRDVDVRVRDAAGAEIHRGRTDDDGAFSWTAPRPADYLLSIDTGDGHAVEERIGADRFAPDGTAAAPDATAHAAPASTAALAEAAPRPPSCAVPGDGADVARSVEAAVARQLRPLIEAQALADARLRLADVVGGIGMIVGLAGLAAWGAARRRERGGAGS